MLSPNSLREATRRLLIGRAHSRDFARGRETTGNDDSLYNPAKSRHCIRDTFFRRKTSSMQESAGNIIISKIPSNQREPLESTRFLRIDKSPSNQPDSSNRTDTRPRLPTTETSPSTACHSSRVSAGSHYPSQEAFRTSTGSWGTDRAGPEPLLVIVV